MSFEQLLLPNDYAFETQDGARKGRLDRPDKAHTQICASIGHSEIKKRCIKNDETRISSFVQSEAPFAESRADISSNTSGSGTAKTGQVPKESEVTKADGRPSPRNIMESQSETHFKAHVARSWVRMGKVALAMAVIRSTPEGIAPEEHARRLVGKFKEEQLKWKAKSSSLKQEVLGLRQQLLESQLQGLQLQLPPLEESLAKIVSGENDKDPLESVTSSLSPQPQESNVHQIVPEESAIQQNDSKGSDILQNAQETLSQPIIRGELPTTNCNQNSPYQSETQQGLDEEIEYDGESPIFPTPPPSFPVQKEPAALGGSGPSSSSSSRISASLTRHAHFLHTFLRLRALEVTPVGVDMEQWEANIRQTALEVISMLKEEAQSPKSTIPVQILCHVTRTIVGFAESHASVAVWPVVAEGLGHFVQAVIETLLNDKRHNQSERHEQLLGLVLVVSSSSRLRHGVAALLTHYVTEYARYLRRVRDGKCDMDARSYQAMYYVFRGLESALRQDWAATTAAAKSTQISGGAALGGGGGGGLDRHHLKEQLQAALSYVTAKDFQLFALCVWNLIRNLEGCVR